MPNLILPSQIANADHIAESDEEGVLPLSIRIENFSDIPMMVSEWVPSEEQRKLIADGASLYLGVNAPRHPIVALAVADPSPKDEADEETG